MSETAAERRRMPTKKGKEKTSKMSKTIAKNTEGAKQQLQAKELEEQ